jgi:hypothetical protein
LDTKPQTPQSQSLSSNALIKPTPAQGFSILYHATTNILLDLPTAVVKVYLAVTTLAAGKREQPSIKLWLRGLLNLTEDQLDRAIDMLVEEGLLYILPRKGKCDEWYLLPPKMEVPENPVVYPATPLHTSVPGSDAQVASSVPPSPPPPAATAASNGSGQSRELPPGNYWANNPQALKFLEALHGQWPKPTGIQDAKAAWVEMFGSAEMTRELQEKIWNGFNWWIRYWKSENTDQQYINSLAAWIKKEKWRDARVIEAK